MTTGIHLAKDNSALRAEFAAFIEAKPFPCVGAKSALAHDAIEMFTARNLTSAWDDLAIHERLCVFSKLLRKPGKALRSFAVLFEGPVTLSERDFELFLWERLQSLHEKDRWLSYKHDPDVKPDPASPEFAFSIGGVGYFVVGMHPHSSRISRSTPMPALVFNPFAQFRELRAEGVYDRMSEVVRKRDANVCGSNNPMLADHGVASAARQFSGRAVGEDWKCPFSPVRSKRVLQV